ncbi:hypothetical protein F5Y09DRAFT_317548 [Xylaria sp. FL1042]|nr:hypothetical protein F5Y09DRAFT_317548 [Xylaria sp. FL1042]
MKQNDQTIEQDHETSQITNQDGQDIKQDHQASQITNQDYQASHTTDHDQNNKQDNQASETTNHESEMKQDYQALEATDHNNDIKQDSRTFQATDQDDQDREQDYQASETMDQSPQIMDRLWWPSPPPSFEKFHPSLDFVFSGRNSYLVYQSYQKRFVTWLVKAAAKCGQNFKSHSQSLQEIFVPFNELVPLAKAVSRSGKIPQLALDYLKYMIKLRGDWDVGTEVIQPSKKSTTDDADRNERYCSLAMVNLRKVRDHLTARHNELDKDDLVKDQGGPAEDHAELTGEIYSLPELPGEAFFAWVCFFNDLFVIRSYLRWHWECYQQASESLINQTLVTNTALRLIRANCKAHIKATAHLRGMPREYDITEWIFRGITGAHWPGHLLEGEHEDYYASWCCYEVHCLKEVLKYLHQNGRNIILVAEPDHLIEFTKLMGSKPCYGRHRIRCAQLFTVYLSSFMHNLYVLERDNNPAILLPCFDELTSGWFELEREDEKVWKSGYVPLWLTISFQICAEMRWILGDYSPTAVNDLQGNSQTQIALFQNYLPRRHDRTKDKLWKPPDEGNKDHFFDCIKQAEKCVMDDNYMITIAQKLENTKFIKQCERNSASHFLGLNPSLCGIQSWWLEQQYRKFEFYTVELHKSIIPAALLYVSMRHEGLGCRWEDMDFVLITRGVDIFQMFDHRWENYHRCPGKTRVKASFKSHFNSIYKQPGPLKSMRGPLDRYCSDLFSAYSVPTSPRSAKPSERPSSKTLDKIIRRVYPYPYMHARKEIRYQLSLGENEIINILEVLNLVSAARYYDELSTSFDWFRMHDSCEKIFRCLRQKYMESFKEAGLNPPLDNDGSSSCRSDALHHLLFADPSNRGAENMILAALCVDPQTARSYDILDKQHLFDEWGDEIINLTKDLDISLKSAATVLQPLLEQEGGAVSEEAYESKDDYYKTRSKVPKHSPDWLPQSLDSRPFVSYQFSNFEMSDEPPDNPIPENVSVGSFSPENSD